MKMNLNMRGGFFFLLPLIFMPIFSHTIYASEIDLTQDTVFFKQQASAYQTWLKNTGLVNVLKVHDIETERNSLTLLLGFNYVSEDSSLEAWRQLKHEFQTHSLFTVEQRLFYKMLHLMEIPAEYAKIQVSDNYSKLDIPCLYGEIFYENGLVESEIGICRAQRDSINIPLSQLKEKLIPASLKIETELSNRMDNRLEIYKTIEKHAKERFEKIGGKFEREDREIVLHFTVENIRSEVLDTSFVDWFNYYEYLSFVVSCSFNEGRLLISLILDGKCGSVVVKPRSVDGYIDMEPQYTNDLKNYTKRFGEFIRDCLTTPME